ncbi:hypothetical protein F5148DRAFT_1370439 [Russula earlei]|uniref:Uncharacterized protein n=1 Tax=Russula earlei TaxID=71964 RepID=A0ACC0TX03_9AGAM|nr:hypothetical protein F5148DRAFT_1370439 [Russula earlei]
MQTFGWSRALHSLFLCHDLRTPFTPFVQGRSATATHHERLSVDVVKSSIMSEDVLMPNHPETSVKRRLFQAREHNTTPPHGRVPIPSIFSSRSPLLPASYLSSITIVILAFLAAIRALPVGQTSPTLVSLVQLRASSCDDPNGCRSLRDIIRNCTVTILLCTWVCVHPNIPSPHEMWPKVTVRRIGLMLSALFVPELMIAWALKQRMAAVELAEKHKNTEDGWTITHGFFAIMGGFMEYEGNGPIRVLLSEQLKSYPLTGNGDLARIAKEEIDDKSKGDVISKTLVTRHSAIWLVCDTMHRTKIPNPTDHEIGARDCCLCSSQFCMMYILWWDKPLNGQRGVRVYKKRNTGEPIDDGDVEATSSVGIWGAFRDSISELPAVIVRGPCATMADVKHAPWVVHILTWPIIKSSLSFACEDNSHRDLKRVHTFYPNSWSSGGGSVAVVFVAVGIASMFGGIHCIGWSFTFSSITERALWRVASVSITVAPIMILLLFTIDVDNHWSDRPVSLMGITLTASYMFGRLVLLVVPFLSLRSIPPAAYYVVHWTSFIPHV